MPRAAEVEPADIVVVAPDVETGEGASVPWARVVGIATEAEGRSESPQGVPVVTGVTGLLQAVADGALVLIDGDRGIVLVDPGPDAVAAFQAERERLTARHRIYLDYAHQVARTLAGKEVRVYARVDGESEVGTALSAGADGLYVPPDTAWLPPGMSDDEQLAVLLRLADSAGSKPVFMGGDAQRISICALLQAAVRAEFTLALPLSLGQGAIHDLRDYVADVTQELIAADLDSAEIQLGGLVYAGDSAFTAMESAGITRVIVEALGSDDGAVTPFLEQLSDIITSARPLLLPVLVACAAARWEECVRIGAAGLIVSPADVADAKHRIRGVEMP